MLVRLVLVLSVLGGCDYVFRLDRVDPPPDGQPTPRFGPWTQSKALTVLNSDDTEADVSMTDDGLEIYFSSNRPSGGTTYSVYRATRAVATDPFGSPVVVDDLVTAGVMRGQISGDGLTFYYNQNGDIYSISRAVPGTPFIGPMMEPELSSPLADLNPAITSNRLHAIIARESAATDDDMQLYRRATTTAAWTFLRSLDELNTGFRDSAASFGSEDGLVIAFDSTRRLQTDQGDLYIATRATLDDAFVLEEIAGLNTDFDESEPHLTPDLQMILFARAGDLYSSTRDLLTQ